MRGPGKKSETVFDKGLVQATTRQVRPLRFIVHRVGGSRRGRTDLQEKHNAIHIVTRTGTSR